MEVVFSPVELGSSKSQDYFVSVDHVSHLYFIFGGAILSLDLETGCPK